jgi:hypothetical protein
MKARRGITDVGDPGQADVPHVRYSRAEMRTRLIADLKSLDIHRRTPKTPYQANGQTSRSTNCPATCQRLMSVVDRWIDDIRSHADEPEPADES